MHIQHLSVLFLKQWSYCWNLFIYKFKCNSMKDLICTDFSSGASVISSQHWRTMWLTRLVETNQLYRVLCESHFLCFTTAQFWEAGATCKGLHIDSEPSLQRKPMDAAKKARDIRIHNKYVLTVIVSIRVTYIYTEASCYISYIHKHAWKLYNALLCCCYKSLRVWKATCWQRLQNNFPDRSEVLPVLCPPRLDWSLPGLSQIVCLHKFLLSSQFPNDQIIQFSSLASFLMMKENDSLIKFPISNSKASQATLEHFHLFFTNIQTE